LCEILNASILGVPPDPKADQKRIEAFLRKLRRTPVDTSGFDATAYIRKIRDAGDSA